MPLKDAMLALDAANKPAVHDLAEVLGGKFNRTPANQKVHSIDITPDMRKSVMKEGQPIAKKEEQKRPFAPQPVEYAKGMRERLNKTMESALS